MPERCRKTVQAVTLWGQVPLARSDGESGVPGSEWGVVSSMLRK